jgi:hypothetical protein
VQDRYLPLDFRGSSFPEVAALLSSQDGLSIDGVFVDCPLTAEMWLGWWKGQQQGGVPATLQGAWEANKTSQAVIGLVVTVCVMVVVAIACVPVYLCRLQHGRQLAYSKVPVISGQDLGEGSPAAQQQDGMPVQDVASGSTELTLRGRPAAPS